MSPSTPFHPKQEPKGKGMISISEDIRRAANEEADKAVVGMCMTFDHSFGLQSEKERSGLLLSMKQIAQHDVAPAIARAIQAERNKFGWQTMDSAPKDGKHCILAVKEGAFIWSVQGAFHEGQWNAVHRANVDPLYWMPNIRLPAPPAAITEGEV